MLFVTTRSRIAGRARAMAAHVDPGPRNMVSSGSMSAHAASAILRSSS